MSTILKRPGTFLLGFLTGAMLSVSTAAFFLEGNRPAPVMDIYRTMPNHIHLAIERGYRPTHLENDLKSTWKIESGKDNHPSRFFFFSPRQGHRS